MRGELVGLTTNAANAAGFDAQAGYAVPLDVLGRRVLETLRQGKEVEYGFLGIGLRDDRTNHVGSVRPGTPASDGGLVVDDLILSVGGLKVVDSDSLVAAVNAFPPGEPIKLKILRGNESFEKTVVLSKFPLTGEVIATTRPAPWRGLRVDYLSMLPDAARSRDLLDAMSRGGVGVIEVIPGSPADQAGLKPGQVILSVAGKAVKTPQEFARAVAELQGPVDLSTEADRKVTVN
jgi:serine protease Do